METSSSISTARCGTPEPGEWCVTPSRIALYDPLKLVSIDADVGQAPGSTWPAIVATMAGRCPMRCGPVLDAPGIAALAHRIEHGQVDMYDHLRIFQVQNRTGLTEAGIKFFVAVINNHPKMRAAVHSNADGVVGHA